MRYRLLPKTETGETKAEKPTTWHERRLDAPSNPPGCQMRQI